MTSVNECKIIFPNLPNQATFNMEEFHQFDNTVATSTKDFHYVTFHYDTGEDNLGIEFDWKQRYSDDTNQGLYHALYVPPFKFWEGEDGRPESQLGFFIVMYNNKSYTGNIYGINLDNNGEPTGKDATQVQAGEMCRFDEIILQDGRWPVEETVPSSSLGLPRKRRICRSTAMPVSTRLMMPCGCTRP